MYGIALGTCSVKQREVNLRLLFMQEQVRTVES
jgi:hypothetical protein